ncbi:MAG: hypothetical protein WAO21_12895 [Verrucomicrobiia bacterium]
MNSSAWDKFRKQQATEREQLQRLLSGIHGLLAKCRTTAPTEIELSALAALLHSFYTGVENIFKRVGRWWMTGQRHRHRVGQGAGARPPCAAVAQGAAVLAY